jgi:hypothetical protein
VVLLLRLRVSLGALMASALSLSIYAACSSALSLLAFVWDRTPPFILIISFFPLFFIPFSALECFLFIK